LSWQTLREPRLVNGARRSQTESADVGWPGGQNSAGNGVYRAAGIALLCWYGEAWLYIQGRVSHT
jgi:hypothetical protein